MREKLKIMAGYGMRDVGFGVKIFGLSSMCSFQPGSAFKFDIEGRDAG